MTIAVVAEKPSVARDIARVIGANQRGQGRLRGNGYVVTWAIGHLVGLAAPHQIRPEWKRWSRDHLPMIPTDWPLEVIDQTRDQFEIVRSILAQADVDEVICATDAGREGELIFRTLFEASGCHKSVRRLWISSLTEQAIRSGFDSLRLGSDFDGLADAARGRSRADWLVGMNLSRAYTLSQGQGQDETFSVGRVQTPTLAMLVDRELSIRSFVPEEYQEVIARFRRAASTDAVQPADAEARIGTTTSPTAAHPTDSDYTGTFFDPALERKTAGQAEDSLDAVDRLSRARRLPADGIRAGQIVARALTGKAQVLSIDGRSRRLAAPLLYDLTELQRHANRLFGYSAKRTLEIAQSLYEQKKLISYPRTSSRHLTPDVAAELPDIVRAFIGGYDAASIAEGTPARALSKRFVDATRVTDHHAIIPTLVPPGRVSLTRDESRVYDLVCRRLLSAWHEDHRYATTEVVTTISNPVENDARTVDHYRSTGTQIEELGWKILDPVPASGDRANAGAVGAVGGKGSTRRPSSESPNSAERLPATLVVGQAQQVVESEAQPKKTRPPRRFSDATLLSAMETAGRSLDDKELSDAMREGGLGTPATRASIIETLLQREYVARSGKVLVATDKGIRLIELVHPDVKSPILTGRWEARLQEIQLGREALSDFMIEIEENVRALVAQTLKASPPAPSRSSVSPAATRPNQPSSSSKKTGQGAGATLPSSSAPATDAARTSPRQSDTSTQNQGSAPPGASTVATPLRSDSSRPSPIRPSPIRPTPLRPITRTSTPPEQLERLLEASFGFDAFRPHQQAVCEQSTRGRDVLLVMPTGAGKSLCYQLPGIARGGTTLVVSPLIALMEDQVGKLRELGLRAERIHSGRSRAASNAVCRDYLNGELHFLFIAPERLSVSGFPELLSKRKPTLIAIDEAHCISQWGHDFRPDYRMLGERLPLLRPAPIIALTATATPQVQDDIIHQLAVPNAVRSIHGFRRVNIAAEVVEMAPGVRDDAALAVLKSQERRPAIVYAPTRKKAEQLTRVLESHFSCAVYHAGIPAPKRDAVGEGFSSGSIEVVVATIAFGMGIDKSNVRTVLHMALPGSVEGYYQEIGRAGRDGLPARAVLLHSFADRRTHEWFLDRDYPELDVLERLFAALDDTPRNAADLSETVAIEAELLERALEKLWIHGGARVTPAGAATRGTADWQSGYVEQRRHKETQLAQISRFAERAVCRMRTLVEHFGDQEDDGAACGICDVCAPGSCVSLRFHKPTPSECEAMSQLVKSLRGRNGQSTGRLHLDTFGETLERRHFERLLASLVRGGWLRLEDDAFEKDGRHIQYQRAFLTSVGREADDEDLSGLGMIDPPQSPRGTRSNSRSRQPGLGARSAASGKSSRKSGGSPKRRRNAASEPYPIDAPTGLVDALKQWRIDQAERSRVPAFRILSDRTLMAIAVQSPRDPEALLQISGIGATRMRKYGREILEITRGSRGT